MVRMAAVCAEESRGDDTLILPARFWFCSEIWGWGFHSCFWWYQKAFGCTNTYHALAKYETRWGCVICLDWAVRGYCSVLGKIKKPVFKFRAWSKRSVYKWVLPFCFCRAPNFKGCLFLECIPLLSKTWDEKFSERHLRIYPIMSQEFLTELWIHWKIHKTYAKKYLSTMSLSCSWPFLKKSNSYHEHL